MIVLNVFDEEIHRMDEQILHLLFFVLECQYYLKTLLHTCYF